jgi:hypothetical protein
MVVQIRIILKYVKTPLLPRRGGSAADGVVYFGSL